jgi:hypothetical protein
MARFPDDWYVKSLRISGQETTERALTFPRGISEVVVTVSPRGGRLSGHIDSPSGLPALIWLVKDGAKFALHPAMQEAQPDEKGAFEIRGIRPGAYRLVALDFNSVSHVTDMEELNNLLKAAPKIEFAEGESKTISLTAQAFKD